MAARKDPARPWAGWPGADEVAEFEAYLASRGEHLRERARTLSHDRQEAGAVLHAALARALASWPRVRSAAAMDAEVERILVSTARDAARRRRSGAPAAGRGGGAGAGVVGVPGFDVPGFDVPGVDVPGFDVPGFDVPGVDVPRLPAAAMLVDEAARLRGRRERGRAALVAGATVLTVVAVLLGVAALARPTGTSTAVDLAGPTATAPTTPAAPPLSPSVSAGMPAPDPSPTRSRGRPAPTRTPATTPATTRATTPATGPTAGSASTRTPSATQPPARRPQRRSPTTRATPVPAPGPVRIDAGGSGEGAFAADDGGDGQVADDPDRPVTLDGVADPAPERVYQSCRWGARLDYRVGGLAPGAAYLVRLHWAELDFPYPGQRVFAVAVDGETVLPRVDVVEMAGGRLRALVREVPVHADGDGAVTVTLTQAGADNPFLSALEVLPQ